MRIWPFRRAQPVDEAKYSQAGPNIAMPFVGQPAWTPRDYTNLARESYQYNAVAYACIKLIINSAAAAPWILKDANGDELEQHDILRLLDRPAPGISGAQFFEAAFGYFLLSGNAYIEAVGPKNRPPVELWPLRSDRMQVIPGRFAIPMGYRYTVNGMPKDWPSDPMTGFGPILHVKDFNPLDDWYGMSRIEAAARSIDRHNAIQDHNVALLQNGATPRGALVFRPIKDGDGATNAPQSFVDAAQKKLSDTHGGPKNAGKPMVFNGDVDWLEMGINPKDMDFAASKDDAARDICAALGVPHQLIVTGESTYNNLAEAKLRLYEESVLPLLDRFANALNWWLTPRYGDGLMLAVDLDEIPALELRRKERRLSMAELVDKDIIDNDEAREGLQYGPRPVNAVEKVDASVLTALTLLADDGTAEPLFRYLLSVGLLPAGTTYEQYTGGLLGGDEYDDAEDMGEEPDTSDDQTEGADDADQG